MAADTIDLGHHSARASARARGLAALTALALVPIVFLLGFGGLLYMLYTLYLGEGAALCPGIWRPLRFGVVATVLGGAGMLGYSAIAAAAFALSPRRASFPGGLLVLGIAAGGAGVLLMQATPDRCLGTFG